MGKKHVVCRRMFCERRSAVTIPVPQWIIRNLKFQIISLIY